MKKPLLMIRDLILLTFMLFTYNSHVFAVSIIDVQNLPFEKIPINAPIPVIPEIQLPPLDLFPIMPSCNEVFPVPEVFFTGISEQTVNGVDFIYYSLAINNKEEYPDYLFASSPNLPPCGLNNSASRSWALIYDENDEYLYGFCALSAADQLDGLWFAHEKTDPAPSMVSVVIKDRLCNKEYKSAAIPLGDNAVATDAPVIAGIGLVPKTFINQANGLATTGVDHPINVKDAPFGKSLRVMGNINRLRNLDITQYIIGYCDMGKHACDALLTPGFVLDDWKFIEDVRTNYFWNATKGKYILTRESPTEIFNIGEDIFKAYQVPSSSLTWYFENLLFDWVTQGTVKVPSGLYKIHLFGFDGPSISNFVALPPSESTMVVKIDNIPPIMAINSISYKGSEVSSCSIVTLDKISDSIEFNITATDPDGYLLNYRLKGEYGNNKTLNCVSENYEDYLGGGGLVLSGVELHLVRSTAVVAIESHVPTHIIFPGGTEQLMVMAEFTMWIILKL